MKVVEVVYKKVFLDKSSDAFIDELLRDMGNPLGMELKSWTVEPDERRTDNVTVSKDETH